MDDRKWRTSYRIICPLPVPDQPVALLDVPGSENVSTEQTEPTQETSLLSKSDNKDSSSLPQKSDPIRSRSRPPSRIENSKNDQIGDQIDPIEYPSESQIDPSEISRSASWIIPKSHIQSVDYIPKAERVPSQRWLLKGNQSTLQSTNTRDTQLTKSQTRTLSWRTRRVSNESEFTVSTQYTDKQPRTKVQGRRHERNQFNESFARRFGTETTVSNSASSPPPPTRLSKTSILLIVAAVLALLLALSLVLVFFH